MKLASWLSPCLAVLMLAAPAEAEVPPPVDEDEVDRPQDVREAEPRDEDEAPPAEPDSEAPSDAEGAAPETGGEGAPEAEEGASADDRQAASAPPDDGSPAARAAAHFMTAAALFEEGNLEAALVEFRASYEIRPHPAVLYNIGMVERGLHRYVDAAATLARYIEHAPLYGEPEERVAEVREVIGELDAVIARLTVTVDHDGAAVLIEGEEVGTTPLAEPILLESGRHMLEVRLEGFETHSETVELHGREERAIAVELTPEAGDPWYRRWWVWTVLGVAVAGVAVGVALPLTLVPSEAEFGPLELRSGN